MPANTLQYAANSVYVATNTALKTQPAFTPTWQPQLSSGAPGQLPTSHPAPCSQRSTQSTSASPAAPARPTTGMSPSQFEAWAGSVRCYSRGCGWVAPLAAGYVKLLCDSEIQHCWEALADGQLFPGMSTEETVIVVRRVVVGPKCVVGRGQTSLSAPRTLGEVCARMWSSVG